jgi:hypothetical protein
MDKIVHVVLAVLALAVVVVLLVIAFPSAR